MTRAATTTPGNALALLTRSQRIILAVAIGLSVLAGVLTFAHANAVLIFILSGAALACLASVVGEATDQLGTRLSPGATGVLQSAIGNLPELFVAIFALQQGLLVVVQTSLIGSILGNSLLVLGLAFVVGGLRHGPQKFGSRLPRMIATLTLLAVGALIIPTLTFLLHTPASGHEETLSIAAAIVLLIVFVGSIPLSVAGGPTALPKGARRGIAPVAENPSEETVEQAEEPDVQWPMWMTLALLVIAGVGAALVSDWFVEALTPATQALGISEAFTGLVIVAIAGNAVENFVGVQLAAKNKPDLAVSVILNSPLQIALALIPALVIISLLPGLTNLTLVLAPLLVVGVALAAILGAVIVFDGESNWLEGLALIGLYVIIAASFWWG
ncbi:MAG TPA: calcium/proton exchanger [Ktedonobacterales bacterium]|jgi:Ca2+:H+ antiporter|nr:calcium/proton exchanger [Ktedonobacterales bacterium]